MKTDEAFEILRRIQEPEAWEPQISEKAFDALEMAIDALALMRWIPVAERLPKNSIWRTGYLATVFCASWKEKKTMYVEWENATVRGKAVSRWIWNNRLFPKEWEIIAWMPLPKPYKEEKKIGNSY